MKTLRGLLVIAIAAAGILAVTQRTQINAVRANITQLEARAAAAPISSETSMAREVEITTEDVARLREANRDIHKLRGQIAQARERRKAFEKLQAENAALRESVARLAKNPPAAPPDPFPLSNKGQATPEAAIESTFWAMHQGDLTALSRLMPGMTQEFERMSGEEKSNSLALLRAMALTVKKLEFVAQRSDSPDEAHLKVQITRRERMSLGTPDGTDETTFVLRRANGLWQIVSER